MSINFYQFNPYVSDDPDSPAPYPIAPTPTSELIERHARLVAVGLANCRAAQGLSREIQRRQARENQQITAKGVSLANYDADERRDDDGKWTAGANATASKTNSSDHTSPIAAIGKGFNWAGKALVAAAADIGAGLTGETARERREGDDAFWKAYNSLSKDKALNDAMDAAFKSGDPKKFQDAIDARYAKAHEIADRDPRTPEPENMAALLAGEELPAEKDLNVLPAPLRATARASQGMIESVPRMGAVAGMQLGGIPAPLGAALAFGTTEKGFDPKQALIAAAFPIVAEYAGAIVETIASKLGVSSEVALKTFNSMGGALGSLALISADQLREVFKLPQDKRKAALVDLAAVAVSTFLMGIVGGGEQSESSEPESSKTQNEQTTNEPNKTVETENAQPSNPATPQKSENPDTSTDKSKMVPGGDAQTQTDYRRTFFTAHPDLRGKVVVHHAIEQQVLDLYPGVMSDSEIQSLANLRGIPKDINSEVHLRSIRKEWNAFYHEHPTTVTKAQLLAKAREIDQEFGTKFNPPITGAN